MSHLSNINIKLLNIFVPLGRVEKTVLVKLVTFLNIIVQTTYVDKKGEHWCKLLLHCITLRSNYNFCKSGKILLRPKFVSSYNDLY